MAGETINLGAEVCPGRNSPICYNVPNDAGATVAYIDWASQYRRLIISLNGVTYDSGLWAVNSLTNVTLYAGNGAPLYVTGLSFTFVTHRCVQEGRVCVSPMTTTLMGGALETQ
jgi:hypothetical protein